MPPKGRGRRRKGQNMGSTSQPGPSADAGAADVAELPKAPDPPAEQLETIEVRENDEEIIDVNSLSERNKKSKVWVDLSKEDEELMVEWLEANPVIYNKKMASYKDTAKKERLWIEKAVEMGKPVNILKTWYASLRSRFGRIKKKSSGAEDSEMTERDEWIFRNFDFLRPHIHKVQKRPIVSIKQKLATTSVASDLTDEPDDSIDEPVQPPTTTTKKSQPAPSQSLTARRRNNNQMTETEEALLAGIEQRSQQMIALNQQVLDRLRPSADKERDAFVDWLRSVIHELDHGLWRRCQQEISNTLYNYIRENDLLKRHQTAPAVPTPSTSQSRQPQQPLQCTTQDCSSMWQPPPSQWPNQPTSTVSVWHSQDANWVAQQLPPQQQQTLTQLQPIRLGSPSFSLGQVFNTGYSDLEAQEQEDTEQQDE